MCMVAEMFGVCSVTESMSNKYSLQCLFCVINSFLGCTSYDKQARIKIEGLFCIAKALRNMFYIVANHAVLCKILRASNLDCVNILKNSMSARGGSKCGSLHHPHDESPVNIPSLNYILLENKC